MGRPAGDPGDSACTGCLAEGQDPARWVGGPSTLGTRTGM